MPEYHEFDRRGAKIINDPEFQRQNERCPVENNMKLADLRSAVDVAIEASKTNYERSVKTWNEGQVAARERWVSEFSDRWRAALPLIEQAVDAGEPITKELLPTWGHNNGNLAIYQDDVYSKPSDRYYPDYGLVSMRTALAALSGDTVSFESLAALGVKPETIRAAIRALGERNLAARKAQAELDV